MTPELVRELRTAAEVNRGARAELEQIRGEIGYPPGLRPPPLPGPRLAPELIDALALVAAGLFVFGFAKRRRVMASLALPIWLGCAWASWGPPHRDVRIVAEPTVPRAGNAASYPVVLDEVAPAGVEVTVTGTRGGWFEIATEKGQAWLPAAVLVSE